MGNWFNDSWSHWFIGSMIDSLVIDLLVHWFMDSLVHWFVDSFIHWFIASLTRWFIDSLIHSASCAWILSCDFVGISTTICSFVDASHNFNTSLLLHLKNFSIGHLLPIVVSFETSAPARAGHYLVNIYLYMYMSHRLSQCYFQLAIPYSILMDTSITYHWNYHVCNSTINEDIPIFYAIPFYIQYIPLHTHRIPMNIPLYPL